MQGMRYEFLAHFLYGRYFVKYRGEMLDVRQDKMSVLNPLQHTQGLFTGRTGWHYTAVLTKQNMGCDLAEVEIL